MAFQNYNVSDGAGGFENYNVSDGSGGFESYNVDGKTVPDEVGVFEHLLPKARAWQLTATKQLRSFFAALVPDLVTAIKRFVDDRYEDIDPSRTTILDRWEHQFGLVPGSLSESERRDRIDAAWKAQGGQSPRYIQDTLQAAGFDVYVHEWWEPNSNPPITRNPNDAVGNPNAGINAGNPAATCGNPAATCGGTFKGRPQGYWLVNLITDTKKDAPGTCGNRAMTCGNTKINTCGFFSRTNNTRRRYDTPSPEFWPYLMYIGGPTWPNMARISGTRRLEFETLCLKICPAQQWLGILVNYDNPYNVSDGAGGFENYNVSDGAGNFENYNVE